MNDLEEQELCYVADIVMGQSPKGESCNTNQNGLPLLNGPTEFGIKYPKPVQYTVDPKRMAKRGDILFCVRGSTTGRMNWADQEYAIGRGIAAISHKQDENLNSFIRGLLDYYLPGLLSGADGSVFPNINASQLSKMRILLPPISVQRAIAGVLSSLDDKIDLLHRQNKALEGIAEAIWRKMFVEEADQRWGKSKIKEICEIINGFAFKSKDYTDSGRMIIRTMNFKNGFIDISDVVYISLSDEPKYSNYQLKKFDFLLVMVGASIGNFCIVTSDILPSLQNQNMWNFRTLGVIPQSYINFALRKVIIDNLGTASGSAREFFQKSQFYDFEIQVPDEDTLAKFDDIARMFYSKIELNISQIRKLSKVRDILLPKLMSGEVRVKV